MGSIRQSPSDKVNGSVLILPKFAPVCLALVACTYFAYFAVLSLLALFYILIFTVRYGVVE